MWEKSVLAVRNVINARCEYKNTVTALVGAPSDSNTYKLNSSWKKKASPSNFFFYLAWHLFYKPIAGERTSSGSNLKNARSIQIVPNNAEQGHCLSGLDWQVTADVWSPRRDGGGGRGWGMAGAEDRENTNEIMQFVLTGKQKICISFSGALSSSTHPSSCCAFRINLLMDVTLQPLPKVVVLLFFFFFFFCLVQSQVHAKLHQKTAKWGGDSRDIRQCQG